jgi:hypothetical protein
VCPSRRVRGGVGLALGFVKVGGQEHEDGGHVEGKGREDRRAQRAASDVAAACARGERCCECRLRCRARCAGRAAWRKAGGECAASLRTRITLRGAAAHVHVAQRHTLHVAVRGGSHVAVRGGSHVAVREGATWQGVEGATWQGVEGATWQGVEGARTRSAR